ncbi:MULTISPECIES: SE1561 family protein [unclassified Sporolactobacillus]|uniref:SE1561 family protein n=1 Tax=unclassified Sporolactobacillus TaxID=2628533 RepID=UPI00236752E1|nr:SE1561 family protein [Sporolactobacillus sp. CQH2019]MDD9150386.1 SE1561 family protein [Sporolactobacillus sp. CQH2019]
MGRAAISKSEQVGYLKKRIKLLSYVINALDDETAGPEDLNHILGMIGDLEIKIRRFRDDWTEGQIPNRT